jgi:hypothetical protein
MITLLRRRQSTKVGGQLTCTWCSSPKLKFVETLFPDRDVYKCRVCGQKLTYITTPMSVDTPNRIAHSSEHPYKHLNSQIISKIPMIGKVSKIPIINPIKIH